MLKLSIGESAIFYLDLDHFVHTKRLATSFATWVAKCYGLKKDASEAFATEISEKNIFFHPKQLMYTELLEILVRYGVKKGIRSDIGWDNLADIDHRIISRNTNEWDLNLQEFLLAGSADFLSAAIQAGHSNFRFVSRLREDAIFRIASRVSALFESGSHSVLFMACSAIHSFYVGIPSFTEVTLDSGSSSYWAQKAIGLNTNLSRSVLLTSSPQTAAAALTAGLRTVVVVGEEMDSAVKELQSIFALRYFQPSLAEGWRLLHANSLADISLDS